MAEGFLFNMIGKLISQVGSTVAENMRVKDDLEKLMQNMLEIKAVVLDAEEQQGTNHQVEVWLDKLRDALDDADNLLDDFSFEDKKRQVLTKDCIAEVCIFFTSSNPLLFSFKMGPRLRAIGKRLEDLNVEIEKRCWNFVKRNPEERVVKLRETHSFIREKDVIGREKEKETLVEMLLNTNMDMKENVSVISIVGFGGLGKTALAQLIYNDKAVQEHFELKMWVCVSDSDSDGFNVKTIAKKIIESKTDDEMDRVQQVLRRKIEGKRYLLVLDDIWNEDNRRWRQLKTLLMDGAKGSKIVITTRSKKVAKISGTSSPFLLKILDEDQAWKLFSQLAFKDGKEPENRTLVSIGRDIVEKCSGFPLAITSVAGLMLHSMETENDWLNFKEKDLVKIDEERIDEEPGNKVFQIIKLSYDHLPIPLKKCFAFCSLFPKGYRIIKEKLIKLWVAQGFVQSSNEICLEDVGNQYFMNLVHRSFFQDLFKDDETDEIVSYQMHDLVHDLAMSVSKNDCVRVTEQGQHIDKRTHHLSFSFRSGSSKIDLPTSFLETNKLRTFLVDYDNKASLTVSDCKLIMSSSEQLRVLHLVDVGLKTLPSCIDMLKHLRYLNLSFNEIEVLPRSITKLYNLEILTLNYCYKLRELPSDIWKLISLRHLELRGCVELTYMPRGIGQLSNLQTLELFVLDKKFKHSGGPSELRGLNNLRNHLEIKGLECLRDDLSKSKEINLMGKSNLKELTLTWNTEVVADDDDKDKDYLILQGLLLHHNIKSFRIAGFAGEAISDSINPFTNLHTMELRSCMRLQSLPSLHLLSHLRSLYLDDLPCLEWTDNNISDDNSSTFFPSLRSITLSELPNLRGWCKCCEEGKQNDCPHQLKSLHQLTIRDCPNLITLPPHNCIQEMYLVGVNEKIVQQAVYHSEVNILGIGKINGLKFLSKVLQHLIVLRELYIYDCEELDMCNDEDGCYSMQWKQLTSLRRLKLYGIPKMEYLPDGLQHVTTLESLKIRDCSNLRSIPEWTASLRRCGIKRCPQLVSLPEWVG